LRCWIQSLITPCPGGKETAIVVDERVNGKENSPRDEQSKAGILPTLGLLEEEGLIDALTLLYETLKFLI